MIRSSRARILEYLVALGETSRAGLAQASGLSRPTVSAIIDTLTGEGIVEELGEGHSRGGRRPIRLRLNPRYGYVAGVDVGGTKITAGLRDLSGQLLILETVPASSESGGAGVLARVERLVHEMAVRARLSEERLLAIGLGSPGIVDPRTQETSFTTNIPAWDDVGVVSRLSRLLHAPVLADNDVNMAARAELSLGRGKRYRSFVFVAVGTGIGAGIVIDGRLHHGQGGAAGEIAQMVLDPDGLDSEYRSKGFLETVVAGPGIARAATRALAPSQSEAPMTPDAASVFEADARGAAWARPIVDRAAKILGMALANTVCLLAPEAIILGGGVATGNERLRTEAERIIRRTVLRPVPVVFSELGREAGMLGSTQMALEHVYAALAESHPATHRVSEMTVDLHDGLVERG